jgi:hypothetical protein
MSKQLKIFILSLGSMGLVSCQSVPNAPKVEYCTILGTTVICTDEGSSSIPENCWQVFDDPSLFTYECSTSYGVGYQCVSPDGYKELLRYNRELVLELQKRRRRK